MDNKGFIAKLNAISRENHLVLPMLRADETPSGEHLSDWVRFLEICVKQGIPLSDDRWASVAMQQKDQHTRFWLDSPGDELRPDGDFRVGLQLLMGLLGASDEETD